MLILGAKPYLSQMYLGSRERKTDSIVSKQCSGTGALGGKEQQLN